MATTETESAPAQGIVDDHEDDPLAQLVNWLKSGGAKDAWDDYSGVSAAEIQAKGQRDELERQDQARREAQAFFAAQSEQGMRDIMGGAQMGTQAITDYGGRALGAIGESGDAALNAIKSGHDNLGANFTGDPGYQFRQQQGEDAINRAAAARGGRLSGRTLQELGQFNSGLASQEFNNYANRESDYAKAMAGLYQQTGGQMAGVYGGIGSQLGSTYTGVGNNLANVGIGIGTQNAQGVSNLAGQGGKVADTAGLPQQAGTNATRDIVNTGVSAVLP